MIMQTSRMPAQNSMVPALERGFDIIELLENAKGGLTFSEIYGKLTIPKPSLTRLLGALQARKYLRQEKKAYKLGFKLLSLGASAQRSLDLREIARPYMEKLVQAFDETTELEILVESGLLMVEKLEAFDSAIRLFSGIGNVRVNLHACAPGKVALAFQDHDVTAKWIKTAGLKKITPYTITSEKQFWQQLSVIRKEQAGYDFQEMRLEVSRIAVPLFHHNGSLAGTLCVAGPYFKMNEKAKEKFVKPLKEAGRRISGSLGFSFIG